MEKSKIRMKKVSRILSVLSKMAKIFTFIGIICICLIIAAVPIVGSKVINNNTYSINALDNKLSVKTATEEIINIDVNELELPAIIEDYVIDINENGNKAIIDIVVKMEIILLAMLVLYIIFNRMFKELEKLFKNFQKEETPFTKENTDLVKSISRKIVIIGIATMFTNGIISVNMLYILMIYILCYIFEYGYELQKQSDETL